MFRDACTIAREFTRPVILCRQAVSGVCTSSIGSFVVVNDEGWIVTAGHIIDQLKKLVEEEQATGNRPAQLAEIDADDGLSDKQKAERKRALGRIGPDSTQHAGVRWGYTDAQLVDAKRHSTVDLAIGRLEPFDPDSVSSYPVFKDPTKDFEPGASLCKYGFPFHAVNPDWDDVAGKFQVQANPLPLFPIEGIFTREVEIMVTGADPPYPYRYVESSSPGLRGQSGGPTFDVHGAIWAIQAQTHHYPLGFNPPVPGGRRGESEHQFLNVGWGVHSVTVIGALAEHSVKHTVSPF